MDARSVKYEVHRLDGYTDGKPSWRKQFIGGLYRSRKAATDAMAELQSAHPTATYRVRKVTRKR